MQVYLIKYMFFILLLLYDVCDGNNVSVLKFSPSALAIKRCSNIVTTSSLNAANLQQLDLNYGDHH